MSDDADTISVEAAVSAASLRSLQAMRLPPQRRHSNGFTLAELAVSMGVLVLLVLLFTQLLNSAANITILGHKQMDSDSQARQLLDRMAIDFAQMVKRADVDYYLKSSATGAGQRNLLFPGNDRIAFYSTVPGYYPSTGSQSPVSLVSYRVNVQNKLERMGKGLLWNGASTNDSPVVFMPVPIASPIPAAEMPAMPTPTPTATPSPAWPNVDNLNATPTPDPSTEVIGPQVFRFEYYYLLTNGTLSDIPWNTAVRSGVQGMQDVTAIVVVIAVVDPKSKALLDAVDPTGAKLNRLNGADGQPPLLVDYDAASMTAPGQLRAQWQDTLNSIIDPNSGNFDPSFPKPAISGIRVYERYFYLTH